MTRLRWTLLASSLFLAGCEQIFGCQFTNTCDSNRSSASDPWRISDSVACPVGTDPVCANPSTDNQTCVSVKNVTKVDKSFEGRLNLLNLETGGYVRDAFNSEIIPAGETRYWTKAQSCAPDGDVSVRADTVEVFKFRNFPQSNRHVLRHVSLDETATCPPETRTLDCDTSRQCCTIKARGPGVSITGYQIKQDVDRVSAFRQSALPSDVTFIGKNGTVGLPVVSQCEAGEPSERRVAVRVLTARIDTPESELNLLTDASAIQSDGASAPIALAEEQSCLVSCAEDSPNCLKVGIPAPASDIETYYDAIAGLNQLFSGTEVRPEQLAGLNGQDALTCDLGAFSKSEDEWVTQEGTCSIRTDILPGVDLYGNWSEGVSFNVNRQNDGVALDFVKGPNIWFLDESGDPVDVFNDALGGPVRSLNFDVSGTYIGVGENCLAVEAIAQPDPTGN